MSEAAGEGPRDPLLLWIGVAYAIADFAALISTGARSPLDGAGWIAFMALGAGGLGVGAVIGQCSFDDAPFSWPAVAVFFWTMALAVMLNLAVVGGMVNE